MVLMCNFDTGFRPPEMVKVRPVVVVSPQRHNGCTCVVVPLSTTAPVHHSEIQHEIDPASLPSRLRKGGPTWAKCDMVITVGLERLDRVRDGRDAAGNRRYVAQAVTLADLLGIRRGILVALGLGALAAHLTLPAADP